MGSRQTMFTVLIGSLMLSVALAGCMQGGEGSATVFVKDAHVDDFESIDVTFSEVAIHRGEAEDGENGSEPDTDGAGWNTAFEGSKTVDLLAFEESDSRAFLGQANLSAGTYNQIVVTVEEAVGTKTDGSTVEFTVTTGWFRIVRAWQVTADEDTRLVIDLNLEQSIVRQGNQGYRFNPMVGQVLVQDGDGSTAPVRDSGDGGGGTDGGDGTSGGTGSQTTYVRDRPEHNFTEVWVAFDEVEVHYAGNASWMTTVNGSRTLDLMRFNESGSKAFLGEAELPVGRYTQIRVHVTEAWGIENDGTNATFDLVQTSYKTTGTWNISENETTQVTIDINLTRAIHKKGGSGGQGGQGGGGGQGYQFTPVIGRVIVDESAEDDPRGDVPDQGQA